MNIDEAIKQLNDFVRAYESVATMFRMEAQYSGIEHEQVDKNYKATKLLIEEYKQLKEAYKKLLSEVTNLAIESIEREKICARLEAEVKQAILGIKEM